MSDPPCYSDRLREARALRTDATSSADLDAVESSLRGILSDIGPPEKLQDAEGEAATAWVDTGIFLATLLLQRDGGKHGHGDDGDTSSKADDDTTIEISRLLSDRNFAYRLSKQSLTHCHNTPSAPPSKYASAWDDALPSDLLSRLDAAFCHPQSDFWNRHDYSDGSGGKDPSPYFSYVVPLPPLLDSAADAGTGDEPTTTALMAIIRLIQRQISSTHPAVATCKYAEWWAHSRPHSSGHQLHFDSDDEGRGGVRNPVSSTVINLSFDPSMGGETLVTSQTSSAKSLAGNRGWLCRNARNRLLAFKGDLLHGVVPGPGVPNKQHDAPTCSSNGDADVSRQRRRVTFMVAFWEDIVVQDKEGHGSARPYSRVQNESWAASLSERVPIATGSTSTSSGNDAAAKSAENCFFEVPVWEDVDKAANKAMGMSLREVRKYKLLPSYDEFFQFFS